MGISISPRGPDLGGAELWAGEYQPWRWEGAGTPTAVPCPRSTSSTCDPRTPRIPASSGWCGKATSPGPSPAASTPGVCSASRPPKGWGHPVLRPQPPWHGRTPTPRAAANACAQPGSAWSRIPPSWGQWGSLGLSLCPPFSQHGAQLSPFPSWGAHRAVWAPATPCSGMLLPQTSAELPLRWGTGVIPSLGGRMLC